MNDKEFEVLDANLPDIDFNELKLFWKKGEGMLERFESHKWIHEGGHSYNSKCSVCSLELYQYLAKYAHLNCEEVCIKQIIE